MPLVNLCFFLLSWSIILVFYETYGYDRNRIVSTFRYHPTFLTLQKQQNLISTRYFFFQKSWKDNYRTLKHWISSSYLDVVGPTKVYHWIPYLSLSSDNFLSDPSNTVRNNRNKFVSGDVVMNQLSKVSPTMMLRFVDIGANLLDERFTAGIYRGTYRHEPDLDCVMERAQRAGVQKIVITAGTVAESRTAVDAVRQWRKKYPSIQFGCTVGIHPTRCQEEFGVLDNTSEGVRIDGDSSCIKNDDTNNTVYTYNTERDEFILQKLRDITIDGLSDGCVVAIGEIGLDYDRTQFTPAPVQRKYFVKLLQGLAKPMKVLPLFLHNRSVKDDLFQLLQQHQDCWNVDGCGGAVIHSFDDTIELAMKFVQELDSTNVFIGLNGCSLRTDDNLQTVSQIPLNKILLETDCPYCDVRSTHAGYKYIQTQFVSKAEKKFEYGATVKNRQEPCHIVQIGEIVAGCHNVPLETVAETCYNNSCQLFRWT